MQNENFGVFQTLAEVFESGVFTAGKMKGIIGNIWGTERRQANRKKKTEWFCYRCSDEHQWQPIRL